MDFQLGYTEKSRAWPKNYCNKGYDLGLALKEGLLGKGSSGQYYDYFKAADFPISDSRGRIIAFGGRIFGAGEPNA